MARRSQRLRRKRRIDRMRAEEQEAKMVKVTEDNSVILERMRSVSVSCDKVLQSLAVSGVTTAEEVTLTEQEAGPIENIVEPIVELREDPEKKISLKRMTKKNLLNLAQELEIKVSMFMTKANIIKAIEAKQ